MTTKTTGPAQITGPAKPAGKAKLTGFGAPDQFGAYVFRVEIPPSRAEPVRIVEHYGYEGGEGGIPVEEDRALVPRPVWAAIAETAQVDFNERLRPKKIATGRWKTGANLVDRMLGKELCVLAWAAEHATPDELPTICSKWTALRPEERWWLFAMTVAEAGQPEDRDRGWRKALYYALADGQAASPSKKRRRPLEADLATLPLFETGT